MLNTRAVQILKKLYSEDDYVSVHDLAKLTKSSSRSVRYNLQKIDSFLWKNHLPPLQRHHLKGVKIEKGEKTVNFLTKYFRMENPYKRIYSKEEMKLFIILNLLIQQKEIPISFFEATLNASRTAIINFLAELKTSLEEKDLKLNWVKRKGVFLTGGENQRIMEFVSLFCERLSMNELYSYMELGKTSTCEGGLVFRHVFNKEDLQYIRRLILFLENELGCTYDDRSFLILTVYFTRLINRSTDPMGLNGDLIPHHPVNQQICRISFILLEKMKERHPEIIADEKEVAHLTSIILSMKTVKVNRKRSGDFSDLVDKLIDKVEEAFHIRFHEQESELKKLLLQHIEPMINRIRFNITLENPLFDEIVQKHQQLFSTVKSICQEVGKEYDVAINDHEVSYLTIYFAAMMEKIPGNEELPKILVVCIEGVAISKYLAMSVTKLFNIKHVDTLPVREVHPSVVKNYDLIISTVDLPDIDEKKVVRINSIITRDDVEKLKARLHLNFNKRTQNHVAKVERLVHVIQESCEIKDIYKLQYDLLVELLSDQEKEQYQQEKRLQLQFSKDEIRIGEKARTWKEVIYLGAEPLLEKGYIKKTYVEKIIQNIEDYGPYMSIAPKVLLSHAGPDDGVNENSMSVLTLEKGIDFHDRFAVPVFVIITLALKETKGYLNLTEKIIKLANQQSMVDQVIHSTSRQDVYYLIAKYLDLI
jgi:transcriptional antiterminator/mannitol/fructose-specific phosphotransferase system IIA component (Ntr-type)